MSNYPNGQPYYSSNAYGGQNQNTSYTISNNGYQGPNHRSSFDAGDDNSMSDQAQYSAHTQQYQSYGQPQQPQNLPYRTPSAGAQPSLPYRTSTQHLSGYQHQSAATGYATGYATYNPAQYSTQTSYNPQQYGGQGATYNVGGYQPGYQPYIPAAYSDQQLTRTASTYNYQAPSPQQNYDSHPQRPHLPTAPAQSFPSDPSHTHSPYLSMPSPPAPAPPPHHDSPVPARPYSHSFSGTGSGFDQYGARYGYNDSLSNQISDVNRNHSSASRTSNVSYNYTESSESPLVDSLQRNPSHHSAQGGNAYERHPHGRTLPGLPSESESDTDQYGRPASTGGGYDDLMSSINAALGTSSQLRSEHNINAQPDPLFTPASPQLALSPDERPTHNGIISTGETNINYGAFANDSDAEAAAGLAAMQAADEQEAAEEARRRSSHIHSGSFEQHSSDRERSDESDYAGYGDLSLAGGGYPGTMHYGDTPFVSATGGMHEPNDHLNARMSSMRSSGLSSDGRNSQISGYNMDTAVRFPSLPPEMARVDAGGTGGLTEPSPHTARRLSYEDGDEGHMEGDSDIGEHDAIPDLFFHPGMSPNRPLPPPPSTSDNSLRSSQYLSAQTANNQHRYSSYDQLPRLYSDHSDPYSHESQSPSAVPRSTSMVSNRSQPRTEQPMRAKTDADKARLLKQKQAGGYAQDGYESTTPKTDLGPPLDLPTIPKKKIDPSKISAEVFKRCSEPWAMSAVFAWIKSLTDEETDLKENTLTEAISALFLHKVPTMSTLEAESLGQQFVDDMFSNKVLQRDEEWVKFTPGTLSGVMYQLTGLGCYSSKLHIDPEQTAGRCYSFHCMRTVKKAELNIPTSPPEDVPWPTYHGMTKELSESRGKKEFERQCNLREIVYTEDTYLFGLDLVRKMYRDQLAKANPPIVSSKRLNTFLNDVFGLVDKVKKVNEEFLAPQLKYREKEQGPWVLGFSDIFREFIRKARPIYVDFAARYPKADDMIRDEERRNPSFARFLADCRRSTASKLGWDSYMKSPITRLQRYILQLETVMKLSIQQNDEKTNLAFAIDELKATAHEADVRVNEVNKQLELTSLEKKIRLRKHPGDEVDLALNHLGRTIILRGDLQRLGGKGVSWVPTHAILFDHYLVLSKPIRDSHNNEVYDVSKPPIHMGLIQLESSNDPAVMKSSMSGVKAVTGGATGRANAVTDPRLSRTTSGQSGVPLTHTPTGLSGGSTGPGSIAGVTLGDQDSKEDRILYPFRVKHLGRSELYTLYALTAEKRQEWCEAIISAKTQYAEALYAQNAEPFHLRVLADTAFGMEYSAMSQRRIVIKGTPLDRAVKEVEKKYAGQARSAPVCRTAVNCATVFHQPQGRVMCAIGTDSGVYISEYQNPRGWVRSIQMNRVTQVAVLEEFNLLILLSDKQLIAYHLDVICPPNGPPVPQADSSVRKAPQKLSGSKDVGFFVAGKQKDRVLVFYQKRDGINSIFKVLEPVLQKSATSRSRWLGNSSRRGQTEFFREYDEFYIPAETYGLNMFHSSLAVATKKGMEVLTLDKKITWGVPNLEADSHETRTHLALIKERLKDLRPLGMFRLSDAEFLVAFTECAVYVNKLGDISRSVTMEFVGRANHACLFYPYLILFNDDFVEIRDAQNGRMKQVIAGKDIHMLDDGGNAQPGSGQTAASLGGGANGLGMQGYNQTPKTVKMSMQHPEYEKSYIVVELLLGEQR